MFPKHALCQKHYRLFSNELDETGMKGGGGSNTQRRIDLRRIRENAA
jgi:hypothetical protein